MVNATGMGSSHFLKMAPLLCTPKQLDEQPPLWNDKPDQIAGVSFRNPLEPNYAYGHERAQMGLPTCGECVSNQVHRKCKVHQGRNRVKEETVEKRPSSEQCDNMSSREGLGGKKRC